MRGPRISYPHAVYHVINRFVDKHPFFKDPEDYRYFLKVFHETARTFGVIIYAFVLMPNHFHLLIETPRPNISKFLHRLLTSAVKGMNRRRNRVGRLMQGRSKTILIETDSYFHTAFAYVLLNPVRAGIVDEPFGYPWSSANDMLAAESVYVNRDKLRGYLWPEEDSGPHDPERLRVWLLAQNVEAVTRRFVAGHRGAFLGSAAFRKKILAKTERRTTKGTGIRRKTDAPPSELSYDQVRQSAERVVAREAKPAWRSPAKAVRDLTWYILFEIAGWSWGSIRTQEKIAAITQSRLSMVVTRMRRDQAKLEVVERVIKECRE